MDIYLAMMQSRSSSSEGDEDLIGGSGDLVYTAPITLSRSRLHQTPLAQGEVKMRREFPGFHFLMGNVRKEKKKPVKSDWTELGLSFIQLHMKQTHDEHQVH